MKKYVAVIVLNSCPILFEPITTVVIISESSLKKLEMEFVMNLFGHNRLTIGEILSFSVSCYAYGEYSAEKSLDLKGLIDADVECWNKEVAEKKSKQVTAEV